MILTTSRRSSLLAVTFPLLVAAATWGTASAHAQTSTYYLTDGDDGVNVAFKNGAVVTTWSQQNPGEYPIAVTDTVRTIGAYSGGVGNQYTLAGVSTGTSYTNSAPGGSFYDGASDGTFNYSVDYDTGNVYRFAADWSNPTLLFTGASDDLGITYDFSNASLWVQNYDSGVVTDFSLTGTVLGSFTTGLGSTGSLALDYADGTFWCTSQNSTGTIYQFSDTGTLLNTVNDPAVTGDNFLGGEFAAVPEPSTWAALLTGGLVLLGTMRARRTNGVRTP